MSFSEDFVTLFRGNGAAYGSWAGGCVREKLTPDHFHQHHSGDTPIGVYPAFNGPDGTTWTAWGCTDLDKTDDPTEAFAIKAALKSKGVTAWVERSANGYHVWVFVEGICTALSMRRMLLTAHQVVGVPAKEVNPKQERLIGNQLGNYVRLPYPKGWAKGPARYMVRPDRSAIEPTTFAAAAVGTRVTASTVDHLATFYREPVRQHIELTEPSEDIADAVAKLSPLGRHIFREGPLPDRDRSTTLLRLMYEARDCGLPPTDALMVLEDADTRWGKFMARGDRGREELAKMVWKVYGVTPSA